MKRSREVLSRAERKAVAADILGSTQVKHGAIAASLGVKSPMLSKWRSPDYDEAPSLDDLPLMDIAAQTTVFRERLCDWYGTPDRSQRVLRVLRLNAQMATALEADDDDFLDQIEAVLSGGAR